MIGAMPGTSKHLLATSIRVVKRENRFSLWRGWGGRNKAGFLSSSRVQMGEACRVSFSRSFGSCLRSCPLKTPAPLLSSLLAKEPRGNVSPGPPPPSLGFQWPTLPSHLSSPMSLSLGLLLASDQLICAKMLITLGLNQLSSDLKKNLHHVYEIHNNSPRATLSFTTLYFQLPLGRGGIS